MDAGFKSVRQGMLLKQINMCLGSH